MSRLKAAWQIYKGEVQHGYLSDKTAKNLKKQYGKKTKWIARLLVVGFIAAVILPLFNLMFGAFSLAYFAILFIVSWKAVNKSLKGK